MNVRLHSGRARELLGAVALAAGMLSAPQANAETGWVDDQVRLNLRTGPGNQYRILTSIETGDSVEILARGDDWVQVSKDGKQGWVPDGFLNPEPPAKVKLARLESETAELRTRSKQFGDDTEKLRGENAQLATRESEQRAELERLTRDNMELRAGARWPEWITGACLLAVGMLMGAIVQSVNGRRARPRIRL
jgi:SH3 domain protein